jgi:hypothetical protein
MEKHEIEVLIREAAAGKRSPGEIADTLLTEMGRGGRTLVIDENLFGIERHLAALGYSTRLVTVREPDPQIIARLRAKVFITRNAKDFLPFTASGYFGIVWVEALLPNPDLAEKIKDALSIAGFGANLTQVIKV